jgi:DNA-binding NarL/FixJ family response regulator
MQRPLKKTPREQTRTARAAKAQNIIDRRWELSDLLKQGKNDNEIAQILKITPNAVKKRRHRYNKWMFGHNTSPIGGSSKRWLQGY